MIQEPCRQHGSVERRSRLAPLVLAVAAVTWSCHTTLIIAIRPNVFCSILVVFIIALRHVSCLQLGWYQLILPVGFCSWFVISDFTWSWQCLQSLLNNEFKRATICLFFSKKKKEFVSVSPVSWANSGDSNHFNHRRAIWSHKIKSGHCLSWFQAWRSSASSQLRKA